MTDPLEAWKDALRERSAPPGFADDVMGAVEAQAPRGLPSLLVAGWIAAGLVLFVRIALVLSVLLAS